MGKFVISKAKNGEYTFNLKAGNGEIILSASETYSSLDSCKAGVESVRKNSTWEVEFFRTDSTPALQLSREE